MTKKQQKSQILLARGTGFQNGMKFIMEMAMEERNEAFEKTQDTSSIDYAVKNETINFLLRAWDAYNDEIIKEIDALENA